MTEHDYFFRWKIRLNQVAITQNQVILGSMLYQNNLILED